MWGTPEASSHLFKQEKQASSDPQRTPSHSHLLAGGLQGSLSLPEGGREGLAGLVSRPRPGPKWPRGAESSTCLVNLG